MKVRKYEYQSFVVVLFDKLTFMQVVKKLSAF
jgi:hypothetical protein